MSSYVLSCCSTADLTKEHFERRNISYVCFHYMLNGVQYTDDLGQSMPFEKFYQAMRDGADTKTSQVNVDEFIDYFSSFAEKGLDILHVSLSSGISGSGNSARIAAEDLKEKYPDRKIYVVDSLAASTGYGLLMDTLADLRDGGMDIDSLRNWAEENKLRVHLWFFSTDLHFYVKGGRVSKASGFIGNLLGICPLLHMDAKGKLIPVAKVRTKKRVIREIVARMVENADDGKNYSGKCYICHSDCIEDALEVKELVEENFPNINGDIVIDSVGTTIGSHSGPGTVALFFFGKKRTD